MYIYYLFITILLQFVIYLVLNNHKLYFSLKKRMKICILINRTIEKNDTNLVDNFNQELQRKKIYTEHEIQFIPILNQNTSIYFLSWFDFIIKNYDNLPDYILFLREEPFQHSKFENEKDFVEHLVKFPYMFLDRTYWLYPLKCNKEGLPHHPKLSVDKTFQYVFPEKTIPEIFEFDNGAQCMKSKKRILEKSLSFYKDLYTKLETNQIDIYTMERVFSYF